MRRANSLDRGGVLQIDLVERGAAVDEPHVRVVEPRNQPPPAGVQHGRVRAAPALDLVGGADLDDPIADDGDGGRGRLRRDCRSRSSAPVMTRSAARRGGRAHAPASADSAVNVASTRLDVMRIGEANYSRT